jgi:ubiquinone/menaquinone biosynthesis C-methylase UbiE
MEWLTARSLSGTGRAALVVGCGLGDDAEFLDSRGFTVVAFDISSTAIDIARDRFPQSAVAYIAADLLAAPTEWLGAFDLVVEVYTVQALFGWARATALRVLPQLVAPNGSLLIIAHATEETDPERDVADLPWPLTRTELAAASGETLRPVEVEQYCENGALRWRAELQRPEF